MQWKMANVHCAARFCHNNNRDNANLSFFRFPSLMKKTLRKEAIPALRGLKTTPANFSNTGFTRKYTFRKITI